MCWRRLPPPPHKALVINLRLKPISFFLSPSLAQSRCIKHGSRAFPVLGNTYEDLNSLFQHSASSLFVFISLAKRSVLQFKKQLTGGWPPNPLALTLVRYRPKMRASEKETEGAEKAACGTPFSLTRCDLQCNYPRARPSSDCRRRSAASRCNQINNSTVPA